jgi:hypothetical protein
VVDRHHLDFIFLGQEKDLESEKKKFLSQRIAMNSNSYNLARRHSVKNEHDLLRKLLPSDELLGGCSRWPMTWSSDPVRRRVTHTFAFLLISLTEEDLLDDEPVMTPPSSPITRKACFSLLDKVCPDSPLPRDCEQFEDIKIALQRKNSNRENHAIAFAGMNAGEAAAAMSARDKGLLHHAQIQRRMTNQKPKLW